MPKSTNFNLKPVAKQELSGAAKRKKLKNVKEQLKKDAKGAAKFFRPVSKLAEERAPASAEPMSTERVSLQESSHPRDPPIPSFSNAAPTTPAEPADDFKVDDPSSWNNPLSSSQLSTLVNATPQQKRLRQYPKVGRVSFNPRNYTSLKTGGHRDWLMYSSTTNSLFCFCCCLFPTTAPSVSPWNIFGQGQVGFKDFQHQIRGIETHEQTDQHFQCTINWREFQTRQQSGQLIDQKAQELLKKECSFWKQVLHGLLEAILFLAKNNLAFRGTSEEIGSPSCGNFLSLVELLSKYYPPLAVHISRIKSNSTKLTYMSPKIQNEFIDVVGATVRKTIIEKVKSRRYYSILFDATPDVSHMEQISQIIRTVNISEKGCSIEENFICFINFDQKTGLEISKMIVSKLETDGLELNNCRGQGYDNGSNMAGAYRGVQARILEKNPNAIFVPCAAHSLNLVGQQAASKVLSGKLILGQIQNLYNFFAGSPSRWSVMKKHIKRTLKAQSSTRWSSKAEATSVLVTDFYGIIEALLDLIKSDRSNANTVAEANALFGLINNFKFLIGAVVWNAILSRINVCNKILQEKTISIGEAAKHLQGLLSWMQDFKVDGFEKSIETAREMAEKNEIDENSGFDIRITRGRKPVRFRGNDQQETLSPIEKFKREFFDEVMKQLTEDFQSRFESLNASNERFSFMWGSRLANGTEEDFVLSVTELAKFYSSDLNEKVLAKETSFLRSAVTPFLENKTLEEILKINP